MEAKVLLPAHEMTTAQCVIECSGYLRTIANQEFEGEDWQTAPKIRRQNLLTDFLCNLELSGEEFTELCSLIGFQLSKTTAAKLAKFTVIAYDWQSEANGEATPGILAALDKCEGVTLIEQRGYRPQARTYDLLRFHIAAFWRCLVNKLRSLCLNVGLVVYPKGIPATPTETPRISTEAAETTNVSAEGEKTAERAEMEFYNVEYYVRRFGTVVNLDKEYETAMDAVRCEKDEYDFNRRKGGKFRTERIAELNRKLNALGLEWMQIRRAMSEYFKEHATTSIQPPQSPEAPQTVECTAHTPKPRETARKPQNRGIGSTRHSGLGANGCAMLDNASATLTAMYVPRECSTADYW